MGSAYLRRKWVSLDEYKRGLYYGWTLVNPKANTVMVEVREQQFDTSVDYSHCTFIH